MLLYPSLPIKVYLLAIAGQQWANTLVDDVQEEATNEHTALSTGETFAQFWGAMNTADKAVRAETTQLRLRSTDKGV
jgi:hypothetical protein